MLNQLNTAQHPPNKQKREKLVPIFFLNNLNCNDLVASEKYENNRNYEDVLKF